jgi:hypothetical protein
MNMAHQNVSSQAEREREIKAEVARKREIKAALESLDEAMQNCDSVGDTRLSGLFHEARTTSPGYWKTVTAFCDLDANGELEVTKVSKLSDGRWAPETRDAHDVVLNMSINPFMRGDYFCDRVRDDISKKIRHIDMRIEGHRWVGNID